ncbi:hypothetical protein CLAFUW4_14462 [Fulvia fulva]|uniref:N-acetyltransferase domain-containing protein n=1 Tax=Passalora fulva TaxID=5499 RepID=A0A9Q8UWT0_PASFU|nr:uncharacterized protein CLAFUR5_14294 [Fulvia fulva]KAK4609153.1 hypothetical protein CLAFUR4_14457 [Fulvia fulva]KAK4609865.1 hypothetical protein CLAFUR0_14459 [Fulvia fulva]UJO25346.1 hypothetical protein CLAFUR5_14294 [Fulvia fulva]WPV22911.1 hypothetical protein CLAFUW4_14462 [Fulvia fulva]WPV37726.1 hypothetical protein CLAFUW7_14466 [Fulvia fulva]
MAIEEGLNKPKTTVGPFVNGKPTTVSFFSAQQLQDSPFLTSLLTTINLAYAKGEGSKPELGFSKTDRLSSISGIFDYIRDDPEAFLVVLSHQESCDVIATATCRRYLAPDESKSPWLCSHNVEDGTEEWEIRLLATHPSAQGCGAAGFIMKATEQEVIERFDRKRKAIDTHASTRLKMVLCAIKELYPEFYMRRGYGVDYVHEGGEERKFNILFMSKTLATLP